MAYLGFILALAVFGVAQVLPIDQSHPPTHPILQHKQAKADTGSHVKVADLKTIKPPSDHGGAIR